MKISSWAYQLKLQEMWRTVLAIVRATIRRRRREAAFKALCEENRRKEIRVRHPTAGMAVVHVLPPVCESLTCTCPVLQLHKTLTLQRVERGRQGRRKARLYRELRAWSVKRIGYWWWGCKNRAKVQACTHCCSQSWSANDTISHTTSHFPLCSVSQVVARNGCFCPHCANPCSSH